MSVGFVGQDRTGLFHISIGCVVTAVCSVGSAGIVGEGVDVAVVVGVVVGHMVSVELLLQAEGYCGKRPWCDFGGQLLIQNTGIFNGKVDVVFLNC